MKQIIIASILIVFLNSCSHTPSPSPQPLPRSISISLLNEKGEDLLNTKSINKINLSEIKIYHIDHYDDEYIYENELIHDLKTDTYYRDPVFRGPYMYKSENCLWLGFDPSPLLYKVVNGLKVSFLKIVWDEYNYDLIMAEFDKFDMNNATKLIIEKRVVGFDDFETEFVIANTFFERKYTRVIKRPEAEEL